MKPSIYNNPNQVPYEYTCNGEVKDLTDDQKTVVDHKIYFSVICTDCCNVPVLHLLTRKGQ